MTKYIVAKEKSIVTKSGVKSHPSEVTKIMIGKNFDKLIEKGYIEVVEISNVIIEEKKDEVTEVKENLSPIMIKKAGRPSKIGIVKKEVTLDEEKAE